MARKTIKTQGDFEKRMNELREELHRAIEPIIRQEDELCIEINRLHIVKNDLTVQKQEQASRWAEIQEQPNIREEKLACLADGRRIKLQIAKTWTEISRLTMQLKLLRKSRKAEAKIYHDQMHDLIEKYPKGTLPQIAKS